MIKELAFQITRRVVGVETVHPAIQKGFRDIILGLIAKGLWIQHCIHQGGHLAQGRQVAELIAHQANCIGEGRCDVDQISWLGIWIRWMISPPKWQTSWGYLYIMMIKQWMEMESIKVQTTPANYCFSVVQLD